MPPRMFCASGSLSESAPLPLAVITTGACKRVAKRRSSSQAPLRSTPPPDQIKGRRALTEEACRLLQQFRVPGEPLGSFRRREQLDVRGREQRVRWDLDLDRALPAALHLGECPLHQTRDFRRRRGAFRLLRHRADHAELIRNLMKKPAAELDEIRLDLPCHAQHRGITGVGGRERGRGIEESRTRHDHADADFAGRARVAIGHVCRGLLVARVNDADRVPLLVERVKRAIELDSRERENGIDTIGDQ